jgi:hypothetical protein
MDKIRGRQGMVGAASPPGVRFLIRKIITTGERRPALRIVPPL